MLRFIGFIFIFFCNTILLCGQGDSISVSQQLKEVVTNLVSAHKTIKDKVTKIKLKETINVLKKTKVGRVVSDNQVTAMMIAYELIQEIKNVKNS